MGSVNLTSALVRRRALLVFGTLFLGAPLGALVGQSARPQSFTLRPGDVVELQLWREPTLSGQYVVDDRGQVTLPVIGVRGVTGGPWREVHDALIAAFVLELREQSVQLTPKRRVFVLGFVQSPGAYFADPTVPIAGAIALAGGASTEGDLRRVRVIREGAVFLDGVSLESPLALSDVQSGDQIYVERRGWFDRNSPFFVSALVSVAGIIVTLIVAR